VDSPSVGAMFKSLVQNDQAMTVVIAIVLINASLYITSNLLIYFFKYDIGGAKWTDDYTLFNTFGGGMQILSMMLFFPLFRKFMSAIKVFYTSFVMAIAGYALLLIQMIVGVKNVYLYFIPAFFVFMAFGMLTVLTTVFLANTVDYGELKNNRRDESVIFSMQTFVVKLASGVSAFIASVCLQVFNISDNTDTVVDKVAATSSIMGLRMTMTILPIFGLLIAIFIFGKKYILTDEKLEEISNELKARN
jgi:melibiose permease